MIIREQVIKINKLGSLLLESFTTEQFLIMSESEVFRSNDGDYDKILANLQAIMSENQGAEDDAGRKAYIKANKLYKKIVDRVNNGKNLPKQGREIKRKRDEGFKTERTRSKLMNKVRTMY